MLELRNVDCFYGGAQALRQFSLTVETGEILCLLGRNGAGKTTALKAIMGLVPPRGGEVLLDGEDLAKLAAHEIPRRGIGYVPQGRRLFSELDRHGKSACRVDDAQFQRGYSRTHPHAVPAADVNGSTSAPAP